MRHEDVFIAGTVLEDGRLLLYLGMGLLLVMAVILLIALGLRDLVRKTRQ
jgi:hypothetical protein